MFLHCVTVYFWMYKDLSTDDGGDEEDIGLH